MKKRNKVLGLMVGAVALVGVSIMGTMAYLQDTKTIENTFTVGDVKIRLDEASVNPDGSYVNGHDQRTTQGNKYHLLPGHTYMKDPTVYVLKGSEDSYVRMIVTINEKETLDEILPNADMTAIFNNLNTECWIYQEPHTTNGDTRSYEFRYKNIVPAVPKDAESDFALEDLFESITVPGTLTAEDLAKLGENLKITVVAEAIQADGFEDVKDESGNVIKTAEQAAWETFGEQVNN